METSQESVMSRKIRPPDSAEFRSSDGRFGLVIGIAHLTEIRESCAKSHPLETGGVLIGRYNDAHDTAIVFRAIGSPPDSESGRTAFRRGVRGLNDLLMRLWAEDEYYLGEWHYHPAGSPRPSAVDIRQMQAIADDDGANCPEPVLLVAGQQDAVAVYVFPRGKTPVQLAPEPSIQCLGVLE